ncbi:MAG: tyrosine-type recombinase/integrase [bacterium]|jgi:integrase
MKVPNGSGSVYRLKGRRRRPWIARVTTGWTSTGRQQFQIIGYYETKREGLEALALHRVRPVSPKANITLGELYAEWAKAKYEYITRATADNYRAAWLYLAKYDKEKFRELRTAHIQGIIDTCHRDKLSRSTLEKIRTVAVMLWDYGLQNDIVDKNYAKFVKLPKTEKTEKDRFSDLEIRRIEAAAGSVPWADTILILIYTGMRISELLNLTRFSVDLDAGLITGGVKTDAGRNRVIPIHPKIIPLVKSWYDRGGDTLICNEKGRQVTAKYYREKYYYPALEQIGIRKLTPHCCRHTFASLMAAAGVDPLHIQKIIGHSDYSTTANTYTHPDVEALQVAIKAI